MALNLFKLFGQIAVDSSGAISGIDQTVGHAKKAEGNLSKTFKRIGGFVAAAFSVKAVVDFGKKCTEAYASIAAEEAAFAQIMGDYAETAQAKLDAVSEKTGVSSTRMLDSMTSLTAKFKGLGYGMDDATTLASDGLMLAADAAAFCNMTLDESMSHLNSFINGSYEGGEAINLFANDTQMAAYAIEKGIVKDKKAWAELNEAQKQATRLAYATEKYANSGITGQSFLESKDYRNTLAELTEAWRQFQGVIGKPVLEKIVLPAMNALLKLMPTLTEAVQVGIDWLSAGFDKIASYFTEVFTEDGLNMEALPDALSNMFRDLGSAIPGLLASIGRAIRGAWNNAVWPAIQGLFKATFGIDLPAWSDIEKAVIDWWDGGNGIAQAIADVCNWTLNLFGAPANVTAEDVKNTLSSWWNNTVTFVQNACEWVLNLFKEPKEVTAEDIAVVISGWWAKVTGLLADACEWALNLFNQPPDMDASKVSEILGSWWEGAKSLIEGACQWTLQLFTNPTEDQETIINNISTWWENVSGIVAGACSWVLQLFGVPKETAEDIKNMLTTWWTGILTTIGDVCQIAVSLMKGDYGDAVDLIGEWWDDIKALIGGQLKATVGLVTNWADDDGVPWTKKLVDWGKKMLPKTGVFGMVVGFFMDDKADDGKNWTDKLLEWGKKKLPSVGALGVIVSLFLNDNEGEDGKGESWASKVKTWFDGILESAGDLLVKIADIDLPSPADIVNKIAGWWNGILSSAAQFLGINIGQSGGTADDGFYGPPAPASTGGGGNNRTVGGSVHSDYRPTAAAFATGLDYVPRDNFLARLHQGEAVLTRNEADAWRNGYGGTSRLEALLAQAADILQDIAANTGAEKQVVLETGVLVGQLAPGLDAQLGMISNRKGRRN